MHRLSNNMPLIKKKKKKKRKKEKKKKRERESKICPSYNVYID